MALKFLQNNRLLPEDMRGHTFSHRLGYSLGRRAGGLTRGLVRISSAVFLLGGLIQSTVLQAQDVGQIDASLQMAPGFEARVFADGIGPVRHIVAHPENGWVYGALYRAQDGMGAVALRDTDGDGAADEVRYFAPNLEGSGVAVDSDYLYFGADTEIRRWPLPGKAGAPDVPAGQGELFVGGFPAQQAHAAKTFTLDRDGHMYVNVGVPSNACMTETRTKGSPGMKPCPQLDWSGGIYRFNTDRSGQDFKRDGYRYSTGHRNAVAVHWSETANNLYLVQHGRDQLGQFFPELYNDQQNAELPSEEFHRVNEGDNLGWPYSYYDHLQGKRILSPEYGGDGKIEAHEGKHPLVGFPGHWAPNGLLFVAGKAAGGTTDFQSHLPDEAALGAFIAFHGSWNRAPQVQAGYRVAFVPMTKDGTVAGDWSTFANGFAGKDVIRSPRSAKHRPIGLTFSRAEGALYMSSSMSGGRVWRVTYAGGAAMSGMTETRAPMMDAAAMKMADKARAAPSHGEQLYGDYCSVCHQADGSGVPFLQPALTGSARANGPKGSVIEMILKGSEAVRGPSDWRNEMPAFGDLSDEEIAAIATYVRTEFGNKGGAVSADDVRAVRGR